MLPKVRPFCPALALAVGLATTAAAQAPVPSPGAASPAGLPAPAWAAAPPAASYSPPLARPSRPASSFEIGSLYLTAAVYGVGLGVWLDSELRFDDPALLLIPPTVLGVAAPTVAYFAMHPRPTRGAPAAVAAGMVIGAGEGLGLAGLQMVTADSPWGFRGLSRAMVIGSTLGGVGGYAVSELQHPSPNISAFATSGVVWGTLVGAMLGYAVSEAGAPFGEANDALARGGLIGFNGGLVASMALSTAFVPTVDQIEWMWIGGGIGALVSLPVYLFYLGDESPPAKRGLLFTATASTLGIVAGGLFGPELGGLGLASPERGWANVDSVGPWAPRGGLGLQVSGTLR